METIGKIVYINLDKRPDRRVAIEHELERMGLTGERFSAIEVPRYGSVGCAMSHASVVRTAANEGVSSLLVLEDDFFWKVQDRDELDTRLRNVLQTVPDYNVIMFDYCLVADAAVVVVEEADVAPAPADARGETGGVPPDWPAASGPVALRLTGAVITTARPSAGPVAGASAGDSTGRVIESSCAAGYLVAGHYLDRLATCLEEGAVLYSHNPTVHWLFTNDQYWKRLQHEKWYYVKPRLGTQRDGFSDLSERFVKQGYATQYEA